MELAELLIVLSRHGVTHYKTADLELTLAPIAQPEVVNRVANYTTATTTQPEQATSKRRKPKAEPIPHHLTDTLSLLKLDDASLVDRLFPEQPLE
jgi:hypothetical protein